MIKRLFLLSMLLCPPALLGAAGSPLENHASPYLAMHADDPVQWNLWGEEIFERARREGKLVMVSSGYFACHWCHVMQRESFKNEQVAALLNQHFIAVKIDREVNPALDRYLIEFVETTQGVAGWPLNVFLTPEGHPLYGTTYLPPDNFMTLLNRLQERWSSEGETLRKLAVESAQRFNRVKQQPLNVRPFTSNEIIELKSFFLEQAMAFADVLGGGFGEQNKFPMVPQLMAMISVNERIKDESVDEFILLTLDQMASQGLRDLLGGGFFRYTVDPTWQLPHFEKMLYDNALLAQLYLQAASAYNNPVYRDIAFNTLDFVVSEMRSRDGAFIASLSAVDSDNIEGGYYLWSGQALQALLSADERRVIELAWGLGVSPLLEHGDLPVQQKTQEQLAVELGLEQQRIEALLQSAREKLLKARVKRSIPKDDKRLAGWNGLLLSAFAQAMQQTGGERFKPAAQALRNYLVSELWDGQMLKRAIDKRGYTVARGTLEDYAYVARGLLDWADATLAQPDHDIARAIIEQAWSRFYTDQGWQGAEPGPIALGRPAAMIEDGVLPSPAAVLADTTQGLHQVAAVPTLHKLAQQSLVAEPLRLERAPFYHASYVQALTVQE